ncbi:hypothetical protein GOODEAATRI_021259 [Goodea atripinnis]|uniref:Uncharacterized protein n=1 Tax=Goodea atripinnis TaxID=208336 RepID=A0ABV0Q0L3_9TELE
MKNILSVHMKGIHWLQGGAVGSTVAVQQEGPGFDSQQGLFLHGVCMFFPCIRGFSPVTLASSHSPKRLTSLSTLPLDVNECVHCCLSCMSLCCPAIDWRPFQGDPSSHP